ncbi:MmgE/PrpD family protein [Xanthobacteraceae bacterium A53D]
MASLTGALAAYAASRPTIPPSIAGIVKSGFIDCVACVAAGRDDEAVLALRGFVAQNGRVALSPVLTLTDGRPRAPADAALLVGTAAHVLDYDDVALASHPSAVMVPAILATALSLGHCTGADMVRAYVVGYETWAELYRRDPDPLHQKGWHPSSTLGVIAATAAVINLLGLSREVARHALGITCSRAGGVTANFGSSTKPLHIGIAASEAILATQLAQAGFTAAEDALEHRSGLLHAISPAGRVDVSSDVQVGDGTRYLAASGLSIKRYPVCYASHRVLDGILQLARTTSFDINSIHKISVHMGDTQRAMLRVEVPETTLQAKFALRFCLAVALVRKEFGLAELNPQLLSHPDIAHAFSRIEVSETHETCDIYPWFAPVDSVSITWEGDRTLSSGPIRFAKGSAHDPLNTSELREKYLACMADQQHIKADRLYDGLANLEQVEDVRRLLRDAITATQA